MEKPRILFISHTFPPTVGGVETQNFEVSFWLSKITPVKIIANKQGRAFLPFFAIYATIKALVLLPQYDTVLLGSGVISAVGWTIKLFSKKPVLCIVHGLDINYNSASLNVWYEKFLISIYQNLWTKVFIPKLDKLIAVGNETIRIGVEHGIAREKFIFIPNGVDTDKNLVESSRGELEKILGQSVENKKIIITSGRLAKRKGVAWFVRNVMPRLSENIIYVVAGDGKDKQNIQDAIKENNLSERVIMLGYVTDEVRNALWNTCDVFVQPNIKVPGDMEGFGISVIEAASCKLPVIAARLEGLQDAIKDGQNGFLVESENADAYVAKINELLADDAMRKAFGEKARQFVIENYQWKKISQDYIQVIQNTLNKN
ncbi:MAG TPA: glycosyltransferase family 4 protein [Patescibacteria group bacterium]